MLSTTCEYAIRALVYLAPFKDGEGVLGREISAQSGIPSNYLAKIMATLNKMGFVEASRGPGGGYRLKLAPTDIMLMDVVRAFEGDSAVPSCILQHGRLCSDDQPCGAHASWRIVRAAYIDFMNNTSISTIASRNIDISNAT